MLEADALKVRLVLDNAQQDLTALREARVLATLALGHAVGADRAVEPALPPEAPSVDPGREEDLVRTAIASRSDLAALRAGSKALARRQNAIRAEALPRIDLRGGWSKNTGSVFEADGRSAVSLVMTWNPFAAGTRGPRAAAIDRERLARDADARELERDIVLEVRAAIAGIVTARGALQVGERGVEQAAETLRVEEERFSAGRVTTNDLLEAEAMLRDQETRRDLARLEVARSFHRLDLAVGL